jgi:hypothetical protein
METSSHGSSFGIELLGHVGKLLADPSELQSFRHWFTRALWEADSAESTTPDDILSYAYLIENLLGIIDAKMWTEDEFLDALREETLKKFGDHIFSSSKITSVPPKQSRASA